MEVCALLLERGTGLDIPNHRGMVPLLSAVKHGHTQVKTLPLFLFFLVFLGVMSLFFPGCGVVAKARCRYQCQR